MGLSSDASAALVFLILYAILFALLLLGFLTGRLKLRSPFGGILYYIAIRLSSQGVGLAFGVVGSANIGLLVAYFILGAEGYLSLVMCTHWLVLSWQRHSSTPELWLKPRFVPGTPWYKRFISAFTIVDSNNRLTPVGHMLQTAAHSLIMTGGTMVNTELQSNRNVPAAKGLRTAGQAVSLTINIVVIYCILNAIRKSRRASHDKRTHPTLLVLSAACPLLLIRGVYGVMTGILPAFNYYNPHNYGNSGFVRSFVISEYIMGPATEWAACALLMLTYFTGLKDPGSADSEMSPLTEDKKGQRGQAVEA
jgi:hypothetical protein